jgi:hypothetical protein
MDYYDLADNAIEEACIIKLGECLCINAAIKELSDCLISLKFE